MRRPRRHRHLVVALVAALSFAAVDAVEPLVSPAAGQSQATSCPVATPVATAAGRFVPWEIRLADTRIGLSWQGPIAEGQTIELQVAGCAGLPADATGAVALNVTSTAATAASFLTVWPTGSPRPVASALNTEPGQDTPNLVIAGIGDGGRISVFNNTGSTHLVVDVRGWFPPGSGYTPVVPARVLDTRDSIGAPGPVGAGTIVEVPAGVPAAATAVAVNVTSTAATVPGYVTVWPAGEARPLASSLNTEPGQDTPNLAVVGLGASGQLAFYNDAGSTHLVADVVGWFDATSSFRPVTPTRLLDTRTGFGAVWDDVWFGDVPADAPLGSGASWIRPLVRVQVTGVAGIPAAGVEAVVLNLTSTEADTASFLSTRTLGLNVDPTRSVLNTDPGQDTPNLVIAPTYEELFTTFLADPGGPPWYVTIYNDTGSTHLVADVVGWFAAS